MYPLRLLLRKNALRTAFRCKRTVPSRDPGAEMYKRLFTREELRAIEDFDVEDEIESDFMNVHRSHVSHEEETLRQKEMEKLYIRKKYFKSKLPNFLSWSDKMQIRHLHHTNPDEWTVERLFDGFPAPPNVIAKVATSNWTKKSEAKIKSHDDAVRKNWDMFRRGQIPNLPQDLVEHLRKFSSRDIACSSYIPPENEGKKVVVKASEKRGEFSEIIESYERLGKGAEKEHEGSQKEQHPSFGWNRRSSKKDVTLAELKNRLIQDTEKGKAISEEQKRILKDLFMENDKEQRQQQLQLDEIIKLKQDDLAMPKYQTTTTSQVSVNLRNKKDHNHLIYPNKITIPADKRKRGCIYKLQDCYYDDDGCFLYRVPGMVD